MAFMKINTGTRKADASLIAMLADTGMTRLRARVMLHSAVRTFKGAGRVWHRVGMRGHVSDVTWDFDPVIEYHGTTLRGGKLHLPHVIPQTVVEACLGRAADNIVDHPAARGRTITEMASNSEGTFITLSFSQVERGSTIGRIIAMPAGALLTALDRIADMVAKFRINLWIRLDREPTYRGRQMQVGSGVTMSSLYSTVRTPLGLQAMMDAVRLTSWTLLCMVIFMLLSGRGVGSTGILFALTSCIAAATTSTWWRAFELTIDDEAYVMPDWRLRRWGPSKRQSTS